MRGIGVLVIAVLLLAGSAGPALGVDMQHAAELLTGILQDVSAILTSFEGGPDDPQGPVQNTATLAQDSARLDAATRKATELAGELRSIEDQVAARGRQ